MPKMTNRYLTAIAARLRSRDARGALMVANEFLASPDLAISERFAGLMLRSRVHEALANLPEAIEDIEAALALDTRDSRAHNELGILCVDSRQLERANSRV